MSRPQRIAILGAGIMGSSLALFLARKGLAVDLFDAEAQPFSAASRWNEGKIHLGFLYNADPSLRTAKHLIPGGLLFKPLVEELVGCSIAPAITTKDDLYLCHRESVVPPDAMEDYLHQVAQLLREHPDAPHYLADLSDCAVRRMHDTEVARLSDSDMIIAGFSVPERSVETTWIADRFIDAIAAEPRIELRMNTRITAATHTKDRWSIETSNGSFAAYDAVINALWQGRMAIDQTAGLPPAGIWSNRYRLSLFTRTNRPLQLPCAIVATGPFGDVKNYNDRDFYLSWYPDGLQVDNSDVSPPDLMALDLPNPEAFTHRVFEQLKHYLPWTAEIQAHAESIRVEGGWIFAAGRGALSDPASSLHRRSEYGVVAMDSYYSVDTGKYSTAPWVARRLTNQIVA